MVEAPTSSDKDTDAAFLPTPLRGKRKVKTMKTPGMGAMMGSPRRGALPSMGKITPMEYKAGGSVSKRADGCALRGKTKGKMV
tara:strand:- start:2509 stop:2757 length:249 start_codon:yes stop_codon:yes gene_type:complete